MERYSPMQRLLAAENYSSKHDVQMRHALNDPYDSMARQERQTGAAADSARDYGVMYDRERSKACDRMHSEYLEEIRAWDWKAARVECESTAEHDDESGCRIGRCYIGSVTSTYPSGKLYTCWTTNQTDYDVMRDEAYREALEECAEDAGGWIETGEGSGDDLYFCVSFDADETESEED